MSNIYFQKTHQRSFGTFPLTGAALSTALTHALEVGYRSIDTAQMYENEAEVGAALAKSGLARDRLCVTTKVHPDNFTPARFIDSVKQSLAALRLEYVDVLLLHWPPRDGDVVPSLQLLQQAHRQGLARFIGVSNYTAAMMRTAKAAIETPVIVNQVEFHPLLDQEALLAATRETGIALSSYCSVARGAVFDYPIFAKIGAAYGKSAAQIVLRWILQQGVPITTMSTKPANIEANFDVMDFILAHADMARIDALRAADHRIVDNTLVPWAPEWD